MADARVDADYVVVGAGAVGMGFTDVVIADSDASVVVVDRRARPGGHWNDAYPFVRLHQPSAFYGVNSRVLGRLRKDERGTNAGLNELASGVEVCTYFDQVMQDTLLSSGRVTYFPMSEYADDGTVVSLLTGQRTEVSARRKVVDAAYVASEIPATHPPNYEVTPEVELVPVNALSSVRHPFAGYVVVGGGKTGIDACLWLLENDVHPSTITWIRSRDPWMFNRAFFQVGREFARQTLGAFASMYEVAANATSVEDIFRGLEEADMLLRLDRDYAPTMFRGATVTHAEIESLARIEDVVHAGRVRRIEPDTIVLEQDEVPNQPGRLFVDCSAAGVPNRPVRPVFEDHRLTVQYLLYGGQPTFSAAITAYVELSGADDDAKNGLCRPIPMTGYAADIPHCILADLRARRRWSLDAGVSAWMNTSRLSLVTGILSALGPDDTDEFALLRRVQEGLGPAQANLEALLGDGDAPGGWSA